MAEYKKYTDAILDLIRDAHRAGELEDLIAALSFFENLDPAKVKSIFEAGGVPGPS